MIANDFRGVFTPASLKDGSEGGGGGCANGISGVATPRPH